MPSERVRMVEAEIAACRSQLRTMLQSREGGGGRKLIITTGDISDVDGFFALAEYAKTGADVMFVMNYPAYLSYVLDTCVQRTDGLGYIYSTQTLLRTTERSKRTHSNFAKYKDILEEYKITDAEIDSPGPDAVARINFAMRDLLTDLAFQMATNVWNEFKSEDAQLFFCIGGVNEINPFHVSAIKCEALVYANEFVSGAKLGSRLGQRVVFTGDRRSVGFRGTLDSYDDVYLDMNGSAAFYEEEWQGSLKRLSPKIRGVVVMGGVYSYAAPTTIPAMVGILNRFSCSTMNQLYAPAKTRLLFDALTQMRIPVYIITNNAVGELKEAGVGVDPKLVDSKLHDYAWNEFLKRNGLKRTYLFLYSHAYYVRNPYSAPRKPFDYYTAKIIGQLIEGSRPLYRLEYLFYDGTYGISLVGTQQTWIEVLDSYIGNCDTRPMSEDSDFIKNKKQSFMREQDIMKSKNDLGRLDVRVVEPRMDSGTFVVSVPSE